MRVNVDELDVLSLAVGQQAQITLDAVSGRTFDGEITSINPVGMNSGGSTKYTVTLILERTEEMLGGMNVSVQVNTGNTPNVVSIPVEALYEEDGNVYVYTQYDQKTDTLLAPASVITGVSDGINVEIVEGLGAGSSFYYRFADSLVYTLG